jgi:DNA-binding CsgD family transcriptional regulator
LYIALLFLIFEKIKILKKRITRMMRTNAIRITDVLSKRELEITKLITLEYTNEEIASYLDISKRTVETHRKNIFKKTKVKSIVGLVILAFKSRLIS